MKRKKRKERQQGVKKKKEKKEKKGTEYVYEEEKDTHNTTHKVWRTQNVTVAVLCHNQRHFIDLFEVWKASD